MKIQGTLLGVGIAKPPAGPGVAYQIVSPANTVANLTWLARETRRWQSEVEGFIDQGLPSVVIHRAEFGVDVLASIAESLRVNGCCNVVTVDLEGNLLAAASYFIAAPEGYLNLVVIEPRHLVGSPGTNQLRGLGTSLVAAMGHEMVRKGVAAVYLHPLDDAAWQFWRGRGFKSCGRGGLSCIRGTPGVQRLIDGCRVSDDPQRGDVVLCGIPERVRAYSLPRRYKRSL